ncbi:MAG: NADH:ubiquinone reductase (Na(+)-transporting) subunit C [Bacteroidales bacterium]|nr:NADH:ubiquinone reductase (Na(+)-transporting) subunit C [Bacteroidales bacterium]
MNTNSNVYTIVYTTLVVAFVAAVLAFTAMKLGPAQTANAKAETLRQMMSAAQIKSAEELYAMDNAAILQLYADNVAEAFVIGLDGKTIRPLKTAKEEIELIDKLKPQDKAIKAGADATLPVYVFRDGIRVIPIYGAGLWGPVWGYVAFEPDGTTIKGAYFDHESETPGLGAKIKDEPWFREKFQKKKVHFGSGTAFSLAKQAESSGADNAVDAISGATMTSKGLNEALGVWFNAYSPYFRQSGQPGACPHHGKPCCHEGNCHADGTPCCGHQNGEAPCQKAGHSCCKQDKTAEE